MRQSNMGDTVREDGINEFKAKMDLHLETEIIQWGLLVELQSTSGTVPSIMQMGCWLSQPLLSIVASWKMGKLIAPTSRGSKLEYMS